MELLDYVRKIQQETKAVITKIQNRAGTNKSKDSKTILQLNNAQANLNTILMDAAWACIIAALLRMALCRPKGYRRLSQVGQHLG